MYSLLCDINDMGELRSVHPGNFTYGIRIFSLGFQTVCVCGMIVMLGVFFDLLFVCSVVMVIFVIYVMRHFRTEPAFFAVYEKGLIIVCRNRTIRRILLDDINEIQRHENRYYFGLGKSVLQGISIHFRYRDEFNSDIVYIPAEYFHDGEKLCSSICEAKGV